MDRRTFLKTGATAAAVTLGANGRAFSQAAREEPDPEAVGEGKLDVLSSGPDGRVIVTDSTSYLDKRVNASDVIVASSFAGATIVGGALAKSIKALIVHDAGVGKDNAAISGLPYGDRYGVPVAAVDCKTATLSNGNSALAGTISHANAAASKLGVRAGQPARDAAQLLLKAPPGKPIPLALDLDNKLYELEVTPNGRILAIWALFYLPKDKTYPNDVFSVATHSARVAAEHAFRWNVKGWISNDAGPGKNDSGISGLAMCGKKGMPAAAVAAMSARIGDGLSTYREGIISAVNEPARVKGIAIGMGAKEALHLMIA